MTLPAAITQHLALHPGATITETAREIRAPVCCVAKATGRMATQGRLRRTDDTPMRLYLKDEEASDDRVPKDRDLV